MRKSFLVLAALALLSGPALAQNAAPPPTAEQLVQRVEQTQKALYAAQAEFYLAVANHRQHLLNEQAALSAATAKWWQSWWSGMFPAKAPPAAPSAPQK